MSDRWLEDFAVGQIFRAGPLPVHAERIKAFAAEFDPQPSISASAPRGTRSSAGSSPAAGTPPR